MKVKLRDVTLILVGRKRAGVSGLDRTLALADEAEATDRYGCRPSDQRLVTGLKGLKGRVPLFT
jgi:hypothetical protein